MRAGWRAALLAGLLLGGACDSQKEQADAGEAAVPVEVARAQLRAMAVELPAVGTAEAIRSAEIRSRITGQLEAIHFTEGEEVEEGQLLFTLDRRPYEAALSEARANARGSAATAVNARREAKRYSRLVGQGYVTRQQYDTALAQAQAAEAAARADKAKVENAELDLQHCTIRAPFAGKTGRYQQRTGDQVNANNEVLVTLNEVRPLRVAFAVPSEWLSRIQARQLEAPLRVKASGEGDEGPAHEGELMFVDNAVNPQTGTVLLKAQFANEDKRLWPGEFVRVSLVLGVEEEALVVPARAVQTGQKGDFVFVVKEDATAALTPVKLERTVDGLSVIAEGLSAGARVVTDGQLRLVDGEKVRVKRPESPEAGEGPALRDGGTK